MNTRSIFLTGATGLIGRHVVRALLREAPGTRVHVLVRDPAKWQAFATTLGPRGADIHVLVGDVAKGGLGLSASTVASLAGGVDTVLHLAGDIVFSRSIEDARATNVAGTANVVETAAAWGATISHVSTAFVAGRRTGRILEADPGGQAGWVNAYEQSKWEAEQLVRASGVPFTIARPSTAVVDTPAGVVTQFNAVHHALRLIHAGLAPLIPGDADAPVDLVSADYLGRSLARIAARDDLNGETLHLCAGERAATLGELIEIAFGVWSEDGEWTRRAIARPALADLTTYRVFEAGVAETGDQRLIQVARSLTHFAPQLALPKCFDTSRGDEAAGEAAADVTSFWAAMLRGLDRDRPTIPSRRAA